MEAAFIPEVKDELDTQNFEKFEEVSLVVKILLFVLPYKFNMHSFPVNVLQSGEQIQNSSKSGPWRKVTMTFFFFQKFGLSFLAFFLL